jgi:ketosteroid isomerase-like protein
MTPPKAKAAALMASPDDIEAQFYEALQSGDIERLMQVWSDDDDIVCVHPSGPRVVGPQAIRESFAAIFANGAIPVMPESVRRMHTADCAVHNLLERVDVVTAEGLQTALVVATNVYLKTVQGWRMVAHHASAAMDGELPEHVNDAPTVLH